MFLIKQLIIISTPRSSRMYSNGLYEFECFISVKLNTLILYPCFFSISPSDSKISPLGSVMTNEQFACKRLGLIMNLVLPEPEPPTTRILLFLIVFLEFMLRATSLVKIILLYGFSSSVYFFLNFLISSNHFAFPPGFLSILLCLSNSA